MEEIYKNKTIEELRQELKIRSAYFFNGFGAKLQSLMMTLGAFSRNVTPENKTDVQNALDRIVNQYKIIPFEKIKNHPDYDLLSEVKELISKLILEIETFLNGGGDTDKSYELITKIGEKGQEYRARLTALLRQQPGHENDVF